MLDLARELSALGHDVAFYSLLPRGRAVGFGLPPAAHRGLLPWLAPLLVAQRYGGAKLRRLLDLWVLAATDRLIALRLEPCDVFIGMSGLCIESARVARQKYGAKVFIERGSRHILSQKAILDEIASMSPGAETVLEYAVRRHAASTDLADVVVVPARHTASSFTELGFPKSRLFRNPYGVDLAMFKPTPAPLADPPCVIMVGAWSYRKGCEILVDAVEHLDSKVRLLHVGAVVDTPLPAATWFKHHEPVPQWELPEWYGRAHVFVLASREEGLSLVQAQALACGLPIVCTDRTGGEDLAELTGLAEGIFVVPHDDAAALAVSIQKALDWALQRFPEGTERDLLGNNSREKLSWRAYGARYALEINKRCG